MPSNPPTVYLHIGAPKSGTTYLQQRFAASHASAAEQGVLWPGPDWQVQTRAVGELLRLQPGESPSEDGPWRRLVTEALAWDGPAVLISMEWMVFFQPHQIEAAVRSLEPARVEVICTARDLVRSFVAQAQEMSKNYKTWPWAQIVQEVREDTGGDAHQQFWRQHDLPVILGRWAKFLGPDRVHLVTVPPAGSDTDVLWDRFCSLLGVDGAEFAEPARSNESLGAVSTVLMQRINTVAAERGLGRKAYRRAVHEGIGLDLLAPRRTREDPIAIDEELAGFLRNRSQAHRAALRELGLHLVGSWDDLVPGETPSGRRPEDVTDAELLDASLDALVTLAVSAQQRPTRAGGTPIEPAASGVGVRFRRLLRAVRRR